MPRKNTRNTKGKIISAAWKLFYENGYDATTTGNTNTLFSTPVEALSGSGTVSVTDRFGKVYTARISW